jgi:hypothetical protein
MISLTMSNGMTVGAKQSPFLLFFGNKRRIPARKDISRMDVFSTIHFFSMMMKSIGRYRQINSTAIRTFIAKFKNQLGLYSLPIKISLGMIFSGFDSCALFTNTVQSKSISSTVFIKFGKGKVFFATITPFIIRRIFGFRWSYRLEMRTLFYSVFSKSIIDCPATYLELFGNFSHAFVQFQIVFFKKFFGYLHNCSITNITGTVNHR